MPNLHTPVGANDNSPAWVIHGLRRRARVNPFRKARATRRPVKLDRYVGFIPVLLFAALIALASRQVTLDAFSTIAAFTGLTALALAKLCDRLAAWRSREFTILAAIAGFTLAIYGAAATSGIDPNPGDMAIAVALIALGTGWLFKSGPALLSSSLAILVWLGTVIPELNVLFGFGERASAGWSLVMPILLLGQIALAMRVKSTVCLMLALALAYGWSFWLGVTSGTPIGALAGLGFAIGMAHFQWGLTRADTARFGARTHRVFGLISAIWTAHLLQSIWLDPTMNNAVPGWMPTQSWWICLGLASAALFLTSLVRFKTSRMTVSGVFILSLATLILPLVSIKPDVVRDLASAIPGLDAAPGFGLIMGAAILAAGLALVANGLRKLRLSDVVIGASVVGIQTLVLMTPGRATLELGVIFIFSLIAALCVGGWVAGATLNRARPATRPA